MYLPGKTKNIRVMKITSNIVKKTNGIYIDFSVFFSWVLRFKHSHEEDSFSNAVLNSFCNSSFWMSLTRSIAFLPYLSRAFRGAPRINKALSGLPDFSYSELLTDR